MPDDAALDLAIAHYREHGWARLGKLCPDETLVALRARADAIMLGEIVYDGLFFQHDSESGSYDDLEYRSTCSVSFSISSELASRTVGAGTSPSILNCLAASARVP